MSSAGFKDPNVTPFESLCRFMDKVVLSKIAKKKELFEHLIRQVPNTLDLYPILRLVFPDSDVSRAVYGLKEHSIGRIFADLLVIPPQEKERLLNWRDPSFQAKHNCIVGDFPSVLLSVIEPRLSSTPSGKLTIGEANVFLSDLYTATDNEKRKTLFRDLIYKARPLEIKWLIRIILKDTKLGMSIESILRHLHPNAISIYHISSSIEQVLRAISSPNASTPSIFFHPIKPMLSERVNPSSIPEKFAHMGQIYLEPKLDGERMIVHVDKKNSRVSVISRNGVDFTQKYSFLDLLTCCKGKGAVFDGEMVSWDPCNHRIHAFGKNRRFANQDEKDTDNEESSVNLQGHIMYVVFDLLFYIDSDGNEHDLRETFLKDRRDLLTRIFLPVLHRIELIPFECVAASADAVATFLASALGRKEEGIIVKKCDSLYKLNLRGNSGWYKIKSDYDSVYSDTLDLIVLGGYFADNPLDVLGQVNSFLVGVIAGPRKFQTLTKVGTGLTQNQMVFVKNRLANSVVSQPVGLPVWFDEWTPNKGNRPDVFFDPFVNPVVLEVRASEITPTSDFSSGYQLRFPRVVKPRTDKDWADTTSVEELREIATADVDKDRIFVQKIGRPFGGHEAAEIHGSNKQKRVKTICVIGKDDKKGEEHHSSSGIRSDEGCRPLDGINVYVVNGEEATRLARNLGATVVKNYQPGSIVVAEKDDVRVENIIKVANVNVLSLNWLINGGNVEDMDKFFIRE